MIMKNPATGFTLVETIVVIGLTGFVMVVLAFLIQYFYKMNAYTLEQTQAVNSARASIVHTVSDLREATYGVDGSFPIQSAATSSVTFFAQVGTSTIDKVHYFISGSVLYRGTTAPGGSPLSYAGQPEVTSLVIDNIRNGTSTPLFTYYDANGAALSAPVNVAKIASVRIEVLTDVNPTRAPNVYTMIGAATIRNLRTTTP